MIKKVLMINGVERTLVIDGTEIHLSEKQEMLVEQMCTDIADVIESEGVFYE